MRQAVFLATVSFVLFSFSSSRAQEGDSTGPNFTGDYVLLRASGALRGAAPKELHILQNERMFRLEAVTRRGMTTSTRIPLKTDWVDDDGNGKVKAYFSYGALNTERAIRSKDGYYNQLDRWTILGKSAIKLCKDAYATSFWKELHESGCAEYSRR